MLRKRKQASAGELAVDLNKSVHSLYYHINSLTEVGLIQVAEYRRIGKKDEAVFEVVSERLVFDKQNSNPVYVESLIKTVRSAMRKAEREHAESRRHNIPNEQFAMLRVQAQLTPNDAQKLRQKIVELGKWVRKRDNAEHPANVQPFSLTCLAVPLKADH